MLHVDDLTVEYERGGYTITPIDHMSFHAGSGELVLLLGPSGCGKTTLLSCIAGILTPKSGTIRVAGTDVTSLDARGLDDYRRRTVGIVFQAFNLIPSLTALENVAAPLRLAGKTTAEARARAAQLLDRVGLADRATHRPAGLSGGQQQRVAIARGLALDPPLIIADEPTAHLDYIQVEGVLTLLRSLAAPGKTLIVATHDDRMVPLADQVIELAPRFGAASQPPQERKVAAGETIFRQGSRGELVYFVERGVVEIVRELADGTTEHLADVQAGAYFGELGPMLGFPRTATARARTAVSLTAYTLQDFRDRAATDPAAARLFGAANTPPRTGPKRRPRAPRKKSATNKETRRTTATKNGSKARPTRARATSHERH